MSQFTKMVAIVGVVIIALIGAFYLIGGQKDASVLNVHVKLKGDLNNTVVEDITVKLESIHQISIPKSNDLITPGVTVLILKNMSIIGEWTSLPYKGEGDYEFIVGLLEVPNKGDKIQVNLRVIDSKSQDVIVIEKDVVIE